MTIYIDVDRKLRTNLYRKPSDTLSYLHYKSNHPPHIFKSIIYSQALRLNLLTDDDTNLTVNLHNLTKAFLAKDYPLDMINQQISQSLKHTQQHLLFGTRTLKNNPPTSLILKFNQGTEKYHTYFLDQQHQTIQITKETTITTKSYIKTSQEP